MDILLFSQGKPWKNQRILSLTYSWYPLPHLNILVSKLYPVDVI